MDNYGLYTWNRKTFYEKDDANDIQWNVFKPSFCKPMFWPTCKAAGPYNRSKLITVELLWAICSAFTYRLYYVEIDGQIVHTSYVIRKSFKFPFLKKNDYQIGPCFTAENARGKGIYPFTISQILRNESPDLLAEGNAYMVIRDANISSIKGVTTAGFYKCANLKKTKVLRRYLIEKRSEFYEV